MFSRSSPVDTVFSAWPLFSLLPASRLAFFRPVAGARGCLLSVGSSILLAFNSRIQHIDCGVGRAPPGASGSLQPRCSALCQFVVA